MFANNLFCFGGAGRVGPRSLAFASRRHIDAQAARVTTDPGTHLAGGQRGSLVPSCASKYFAPYFANKLS